MRKNPIALPQKATPQISGIVDRLPSALKEWPGNPRKHQDRQLTKIAASIREFGYTNPVITDETGTIQSGHGWMLASRQLPQQTIPTRIISGLTEAQKRVAVCRIRQ